MDEQVHIKEAPQYIHDIVLAEHSVPVFSPIMTDWFYKTMASAVVCNWQGNAYDNGKV